MNFFGRRGASALRKVKVEPVLGSEDAENPVPGGATDNPYLNARRTWNAHTGAVVSARQMWQIVGVLCLLITLCAVAGVVWLGSQSKLIPYMVRVDQLGQVGPAVVLDRLQPADPRVIHATVAGFVGDARMVTPDIALQRKAVFRIYSHLAPNDPGTNKMNEYLNGSADASPFKRAENETVTTEIISVLPQTAETWQVDWRETVRDRAGIVKTGPTRMRALVNVYVAPPTPETTEQQIRDNPLRIFVRDYNWSRML